MFVHSGKTSAKEDDGEEEEEVVSWQANSYLILLNNVCALECVDSDSPHSSTWQVNYQQ